MGVELMADDQWLIFNRGGRLDAWNLGQAMTVDQVAEMVTRARLLLGIDATDDTAGVASVSPGQPHPQTLRLTTVHELSELITLTPDQVGAYRSAQSAARRQARVDAAASAVATLPAEEQTELRTRLGWGAPRPNGMPKG